MVAYCKPMIHSLQFTHRFKISMSHWLLVISQFLILSAFADPGRIYTGTDVQATGGIEGRVELELTHALAIDHARLHVYRADLTDNGRAFHFLHLPVGKYDLVFLAKNKSLFEGLTLGNTGAELPPVSTKNLETRVAVADSFFNRYKIHRIGFEGDRAFVLVERLRDKLILKQSGEKLDSNLRRFEVIELEQAGDDWQMVTTRHFYREEEPVVQGSPFFKHFQISELGNIRVVDNVKQLGALPLPNVN